jgi:membrane protein
MFPIVLGLISALLFVNPNSQLAQQVEVVIRDTFPLGTRTEIQGMLLQLNRHPGTYGLLSLVAMLWAGSAMFSCLGGALNALHGAAGRNLFHQRLIGLRLLAVLALGLTIVVLERSVSARLPLPGLVSAVVAGLVLVMVLGFIYRGAPNIRRAPREVLPGAVIGAILIEVATYTFPIYGRLTEQTSTYGRGVATALVLLFWLWLVSHVILLGAYFNDTRWEMIEERARAAEREVAEDASGPVEPQVGLTA